MEVLYQLSFAAQMTQGPHYARPLRYRFRLRASTPTAAPLMPAPYDDRAPCRR